ncbi:pheST operon leader peptide PheM [Escherichia coli]|uniref:pheST attenuator peptide n=3 Tax=Enterobacteriaceae TaxID=543 RepID=A0AAW6VTW5_ECOLX|nr:MULTISPECIES: pheST operon leader peptide PheM [Enterobacteriaceae]EEZ7061625.1 pheST operon leader peptide PheM [Escherichia coli O17]EHD3372807.1 pheST operon leader peptide PheM [Escherichia coli O124]TGC94768.1 hypothetical protein C9F09_09375 [Salmonella enterica subsp. enterica serovar Wilhelmsburg]HAZ2829223.1 pheST operon leader peptide PheM [Salmonella enterica subsp. enterica serovar Infantis]HEO1739748.1 pheST operon leader peptide PheM [Klebsiella pneumoniae]
MNAAIFRFFFYFSS